MKNNKLISMVAYIVLMRLNTEFDNIRKFWKCESYAAFLSQPLEIWQLIPSKLVDGVWVVLEEPKEKICCSGINRDCGCMGHPYIDDGEIEEYQEAKAKVIFEGFEIVTEIFVHNSEHYYIQKDRFKLFWNFNDKWELYKGFKTIEDLIPYNLTLTDKQASKLNL